MKDDDSSSDEAAGSEVVPLESERLPEPPAASAPRRRASAGQGRIWLHERLRPGTPLYNLRCGVWMRGQVDVERLHLSLQDVVRRHGALRTTLEEGEAFRGRFLTKMT